MEDSLVKAGSDNGNTHLILEIIGAGSAKDDVCIGICGLLNDAGSSLNIVQSHLRRTGDIDQNAGSAVDGSLQQGAGDGGGGSLLGLLPAGSGADTHVSPASVLHDGGNVSEVQVDNDLLGEADQLGDGGHGLLQHIVSNAECVGKSDLLIGHVLQAVIGDDDQGIDLAVQVGNTLLCLTHPVGTLELEGLGDNTDGQDAGLMGQVSNDGSRAGAGAAAHAGGDEDHISAFQRLGNGSPGLLGRLLADLRLGTCAHAAGELLTDLDLILANGLIQVLLIRVDNDEIHTAHTGFDHTINNIVAGAADTNHFNFNNAILQRFGHNLSSYVSFFSVL